MCVTESLIIRRATAVDVDAIVRIVNAGGPDGKARTQLPDVLPPAYAKTFELIDADENQHLMVAVYNQQVVGTFHLTFLFYLAACGRPDAQIEAIHVAEPYRGKGIGTAMLQWSIDEATRRNCRRVQLTTDKLRTLTHELYRKVGFEFSHEGAKLYLR